MYVFASLVKTIIILLILYFFICYLLLGACARTTFHWCERFFPKAQIYYSRDILVILDVQGYISNFKSIRGIWVILSI